MSSAVIRARVALLVATIAVSARAETVLAAECVSWVETTVTGDSDGRTMRVCTEWAASPGGSAQPVRSGPGGGQAAGGGDGGTSNCDWTPAVEGISGEVVPGLNTRTNPDGTVMVRYFTNCPPARWVWVPVQPGATPTAPAVPVVTPADLIPEAFDRIRRQLPTPEPRIAPADLAPDGYAFVQNPVFFWIDQGSGQWENVSATASLATLSLTITAAPKELAVSTGDGGSLRCPGAPPAFPTGADPTTFAGCGHTYTDSSAMAPNGATFPVTVSIVWHVTWTASNGESGDLGTLTTTSDTRDLPVAEIQAIITG